MAELPSARELPMATSGEPYSFTIEARDDFSERRRFGGDLFKVAVSGEQQGSGRLMEMAPSLFDHGDGTYDVRLLPGKAGAYLVAILLTYSLTHSLTYLLTHSLPGKAGAYLVAISLDGQPIAGSRFLLAVRGSSAHGPSCVASGRGLRTTTAGEAARFAVQVWDLRWQSKP